MFSSSSLSGGRSTRSKLSRLGCCIGSPGVVLYDYLRRRGRELTVEPSDLQDLAGGTDGDDFATVDRHHDLGKALATLTEQQRQALLMKYVANLSVAECAETFGTGVDNMKKILGKAREALRQAPGMDAYNSAVTAKEVRG